MNTERKAIKEVLNICHDGVKGYERAAEDVENEEFRTIFHRLAQQRKLFIEELKNDMRDRGADLEDSGTVKGYFHRNWLDIKATFSGKEDSAVISEARTGEKEALDVYDEALNSDVPQYIKDRLQKQRRLIAGAIVQLNEFERELAG
ncbi:PA2169 family four-helix-bundle protein [Fulvivirga ulvae]|uniref:ferritin-like domain-containing protein n=1 Tax=Fulvivirga ulvae TaxID=2904245 RepID=UPI001F25A532|nr:PA2169 family four-helix-bundle protein [Fulvivirga ulvae]UII32087.1 PA2169 family four-helix-bundle protein [Fulvivirga ulvae]